jgi:hypothetical protein
MRRLPLLPERPRLAPLRPITSARTALGREGGRLVLTIEHQVLRGITPQMLAWWFQHIDGSLTVDGVAHPRYLLWHPVDHIRWELASPDPAGGAGQGARFRIVEAFGGNPDFYVDSTELVEKLDHEGISLVRRLLGREVFRLEHRWDVVPGGSSYRSRMVVGASGAVVGRLFNALVRPRVFPDEMGRAWLVHNVEEVGLLEQLLPALLGQDGGRPQSLSTS